MFFIDEHCKIFFPMELVEHGDRSQAHHLLRVPLPRGSEALICLVFKEFYVRMTWVYYPRCGAYVVVRNAMAGSEVIAMGMDDISMRPPFDE